MRGPLGMKTFDVYTIPPEGNIFSIAPRKTGNLSPEPFLYSERYQEPNSITTSDHSPFHL